MTAEPQAPLCALCRKRPGVHPLPTSRMFPGPRWHCDDAVCYGLATGGRKLHLAGAGAPDDGPRCYERVVGHGCAAVRCDVCRRCTNHRGCTAGARERGDR